jgi:hypothetical protein
LLSSIELVGQSIGKDVFRKSADVRILISHYTKENPVTYRLIICALFSKFYEEGFFLVEYLGGFAPLFFVENMYQLRSKPHVATK